MNDPLIDYYQSKGKFTGNVWQVKFDTMPISAIPTEDYEWAKRTMSTMTDIFSRIIDDALFSGATPNPDPIPAVCEGNQHVFAIGATHCQCGKVQDV